MAMAVSPEDRRIAIVIDYDFNIEAVLIRCGNTQPNSAMILNPNMRDLRMLLEDSGCVFCELFLNLHGLKLRR